jgi:ATP-dependent DNA helicase RecG
VIELKPVTVLRGVGDALALRLRALGVQTTQDLLFLLPSRYEDRTRIVPLGELRAGQRAAVEGEVQLTEVVFRGRRQMLCKIADGSGFLTLRFFHFNAQQQQGLARGARIRCFGEARRGPMGLEIVHPEYRRVDPHAAAAPEEHLTPIYPLTLGVTQGRLRMLVGLALEQTGARDVEDWLPASVLADSQLPSLSDALRYVHRPPADAPVDLLLSGRHPAQRRLAFEELLAHQLSLKLLRQRIQSDPGWPLQSNGALKASLLTALPFRLTKAQQRALLEIERDLGLGKPMLRLVQGDVGCGKT